MEGRDYARVLLKKAAQDEFVMLKLMECAESPDEAIGFHAQQAVEKSMKAVLSSRGVRFRKTHDLTELVDLLRDSGVTFPGELDDVTRLTPFATFFRYEDLWADPEGRLDRAWMTDCVRKTMAWAEVAVGQE